MEFALLGRTSLGQHAPPQLASDPLELCDCNSNCNFNLRSFVTLGSDPTTCCLAHASTSSPTEQTWCMTTRDRCREQTYSKTHAKEDMLGRSWAYCSPNDNKPELPNCECLGSWNSGERCDDGRHLNNITGCPAKSTLLECGIIDDDEPSFCDTVHVTCKQQNYEAVRPSDCAHPSSLSLPLSSSLPLSLSFSLLVEDYSRC